MQVQKALETRT